MRKAPAAPWLAASACPHFAVPVLPHVRVAEVGRPAEPAPDARRPDGGGTRLRGRQRRRRPRLRACGGAAPPNTFFMAAMCLHALPACANDLHAQYHLPRTCAILYHLVSLDCDCASYSHSAVFLAAISPRFDLWILIVSGTIARRSAGNFNIRSDTQVWNGADTSTPKILTCQKCQASTAKPLPRISKLAQHGNKNRWQGARMICTAVPSIKNLAKSRILDRTSATTSARTTLRASRTPRRTWPGPSRTTTPAGSTRRSGGNRPTSSSGSGKGTPMKPLGARRPSGCPVSYDRGPARGIPLKHCSLHPPVARQPAGARGLDAVRPVGRLEYWSGKN